MKIIKLAKTLLCLIGTIPTSFVVVSCQNTIVPTSITINFPEEIKKDDTFICSAIVEPQTANQDIVWDTSDHTLATIDPNTKKFMAKDYGEVIVFATSALDSNIFSYKKIQIQSVPEKISIIGDKDIALNCRQKYQVEVEPKEASQEHTWELNCSSDVAEIDLEGNLIVHKAPKSNQIILIAKSINKKISYAQMVINIKPTPESIEIYDCPDEIEVNQPYQCRAKCSPEDTKQDVIWFVDDEEYASIEGGELIGKKPGTITVKAQSAVNEDVFVEKQVTILEYVPKPDNFSTDSWQTIATYLKGGLAQLKEAYGVETFVGKTRQIKLWSIPYDVRVIGENQDVDVEGKPVALTFEFVQPLVYDCTPEGFTYFRRKYIAGDENGGHGFWYNSDKKIPSSLWTFLNEVLEEEISKSMGYTSENSIIKTVKKFTCGASEPNDSSVKLMESHDKIFLLSLVEKFNSNNLKNITVGRLNFIPQNMTNFYSKENQRYQWYANNEDDEIKNAPDSDGHCPKYYSIYEGVSVSAYHYCFLRSINVADTKWILQNGDVGLTIQVGHDEAEALLPAFCI